MPPMEIFMEVSYEERRTMLYRDLEKGDILVGRINNIREYGFFLTLLCTAGGLRRDIEDLELSVCHSSYVTNLFKDVKRSVILVVSADRNDQLASFTGTNSASLND